MELTFEEKKEKIKNFRPIDDVFFEVLAANKGVCRENGGASSAAASYKLQAPRRRG